jgi:hypothetical protein
MFTRLRRELIAYLGVARHDVRPGVSLEVLLPVERRQGIWQHLRGQGFRLPPLQRYPHPFTLPFNVLGLEDHSLLPAILLRLGLIEPAEPARPFYFPLGLRTLGDLVLYLTSVREHRESGYRWTRNEIATRVRIIVAENLGLTLDEVQPETSFWDLGAD